MINDEPQCAGCGSRDERAFLFCLDCIAMNKPLPIPYPCLFPNECAGGGPVGTPSRYPRVRGDVRGGKAGWEIKQHGAD